MSRRDRICAVASYLIIAAIAFMVVRPDIVHDLFWRMFL